MGKKKMKLLSLLKNTQVLSLSSSSSSSSSWPWPSCHQPRTLSFRAKDDTFKTINSAYLDATMDILESSESFFTVSPKSDSFSMASEESIKEDSIETVIRGLRSERLFFEPDETSSILEAKVTSLPFKDSVVLSMESQDPYVDFRKSMEEMVAAQGVKDWEGLQELLCWYLRVNGKINHGYIVGAFVDLLVGLAFALGSSSSSSSSSHSPSSPLSFHSSSLSSCSTRCVSCLEAEVRTPSSSLLLEHVRKGIKHKDEASSSSSNT
ncbi:transcription repressor OFP13-like [Gastrolobium bilobum]|uniref:transcription repressor OFP13-like n=1 Tax=Gastrolobium bilobum TaxID=150636 RepID=UPI002AAFE24A|nr:transcription repressor OFP13-like [Gastrolobium bilobum]